MIMSYHSITDMILNIDIDSLVQMPRIWVDYCKFLTKQGKVVTTRRVFDRALRALPPTQHDRVWPLYIKFVTAHNIPETGVRVFRRYLQMFPDNSEEYVEYLISIDRLDEASQVPLDLSSPALSSLKCCRCWPSVSTVPVLSPGQASPTTSCGTSCAT